MIEYTFHLLLGIGSMNQLWNQSTVNDYFQISGPLPFGNLNDS